MALLSVTPLFARAQVVTQRKVGVSWKDRVPVVSVSLRDLATADVRAKLQSGLPQTLVIRAQATPPASTKVLAANVRVCRVVYDLWSDVYRVESISHEGAHARWVPKLEQVLAQCLVLSKFPVGRSAEYASSHGQVIRFLLSAEFNPLSKEALERIRKWLAGGRQSGRMESENFFGSFVSMFVNQRFGQADRAKHVTSQGVRVP